MPEIVIPEFMDGAAVKGLAAEFDVLHDPWLVERPAELTAALATAEALIVRNRTKVRGALLEAAANLRVVGRLGVGLDRETVAAEMAHGSGRLSGCPRAVSSSSVRHSQAAPRTPLESPWRGGRIAVSTSPPKT